MKIYYLNHEDDILNTNETMNDYSFFYQMICENKPMDFESQVKEMVNYVEL